MDKKGTLDPRPLLIPDRSFWIVDRIDHRGSIIADHRRSIIADQMADRSLYILWSFVFLDRGSWSGLFIAVRDRVRARVGARVSKKLRMRNTPTAT